VVYFNAPLGRRVALRNELDFAEHSHLLSEGLFADRVILALSRFDKTRQLSAEERETLERAKIFLNNVIKGGNFSTGVSSVRDMESVEAFTHAVDSAAIRVSSRSDFLHYVDELLNTVTKILANEPVSEEELNQVDAFFSRYGRSHFQRSRGMLESV
jgi:hypothetical protein